MAPRALLSCRFDTSLSYTGLFVATATTGNPFVDQRDGAVLHLAGRIGLGVQVADLLELERALAADRRAHAAAHEQRAAARPRTPVGRLLDGRLALGQDALDLLGGIGQLAEQQA